MSRFGIALLLAAASAAAHAQPVTRADLKPGLVFTAADAAGATVTRVEPTVALTLAAGEAAHPRSADGGQSFRWDGYINVLLPGKYRFDAVVLGDLTVAVGGAKVLTASSPRDGTDPAKDAVAVTGPDVELAAGIQPISAMLTRTGKAVRVDLLWSGPGFQPEPIPNFFLGHLPKQRPASFAKDMTLEHGQLLFEELSCVRCHKPDAADKAAKSLAERTGPNLSEIGKRVHPGWLDAWLADPHQHRPNTVMPKMFADTAAGKAERYAVVAYLASLGKPADAKPVDGGQMRKSIGDGQKLFLTAGCAACHGDKLTGPPTKKVNDDPEADDKPTFQPEDFVHALGTAGPTGYYRLGAVGSKWRADALAAYLQDPLKTNPHGRMPNMVLTGDEARDLARFLTRTTDDALSPDLPAAPKADPAEVAKPLFADLDDLAAEKAFAKLPPAGQWKELGKRLVSARGCVNCHAVEPAGKKLPAASGLPDLAATRKAGAKGCLSETPDPAKVPAYKLDAREREALTAFLKDGLTGGGSPAPAYEARRTLKRLNCLNCHVRDGEGGIDVALSDVMKALEKAENADDVQPPRLTGAGHKLRTPWLSQVLTGAGRARPWMGLRMPQYGPQNVGHLPDALPKLEGTVTDQTVGKATFTAAKIEAGRALAGKTGFGCVACHDISGVTGGGTRGPDLATTNQRVRHDWYVRWMHQPQRLAPGTRMPQNFVNGKSQIDAVLGGDADQQIDALWAYFSLGPGLPLPSGMEPPKGMVVAVKDRPELLRTFMPDNAGTKAIAVGYPGGVSLVFDAAQGRLGYAWTGNFLDMTPVWDARGGRPAKLLGPKFWTAPPGHPWAITDSRSSPPDFLKRADDPAYGFQLPEDRLYVGPRLVRFDGYGLDSQGNPTFRYELVGPDGGTQVRVAESPAPLPVSVAAGLRRAFAYQAKVGRTPWFFAGQTPKEPRAFGPSGTRLPLDLKADSPELPGVGSRLVLPDDAGRASVVEVSAGPPGTVWRFVPRPGGGWVALVRLPESADGGVGELVLSVWGLPRDDDELAKGLKAGGK